MCCVSIPAAAHAAAGSLRSTAEPVQHHHQLRRQRCVEHVWDAPVVQRELHRRRMQEQALEPDLLAQALVDVRIAILVVARDRMADVLRMHADLVGAAGLDAHLAVRMPAAPLQRAEMAQRRLAAIIDRSEEHTSELQSLMRISYAVFCLKKKK